MPRHQFHVAVALEAIKNDKHVMVIKPLADSEEAARELVEAAEAAGVVNMMSLSPRFAEDTRCLGKLAQDGECGDYRHVGSVTTFVNHPRPSILLLTFCFLARAAV